MWKYKHNIQTEIEDTPGGSTISMSALGNTSHTTQTTNSKHCEILIEGILCKGEISQLYRNKFQNVFSPMRQISKQALQQVGFFFKLSSLSLSSRNSSNTLQLYWMFKFFTFVRFWICEMINAMVKERLTSPSSCFLSSCRSLQAALLTIVIVIVLVLSPNNCHWHQI